MKTYTLQGLMVLAICLVTWGVAASTAQAHPDYGCNGCHVPHAAAADKSVPLWNPQHTTTTLTGKYTSDTMDATTSAPDGASKLCLSCHDGSYDHITTEHAFGSGNGMGTLATNHPISFVYDSALASADGELVDPTTLAKDVLDANSKMQCTSCHDIHGTETGDVTDDPNTAKDETVSSPNLRWNYYGRAATASFCRNCHEK